MTFTGLLLHTNGIAQAISLHPNNNPPQSLFPFRRDKQPSKSLQAGTWTHAGYVFTLGLFLWRLAAWDYR